MELFLGIDLGTSYFKAGLFDGNGNLRGLGRELVKKYLDKGGVCELPVNVFWDTLSNCIKQALQAATADINDIMAISYSSQANSFILLDADHHPLTPLLLWPDTRGEIAKPILKKVCSRVDFQERTGLGIQLSDHSCVAKLLFFQKEQPLIWNKVRSIMSISDYLIFTLTGQKMTDFSTSSLSGLLDVQNGGWWRESLNEFNLNASYLPAPYRIGTPAGELTGSGARKLGLSAGVPVCLGGLDHHVAAIGAGVLTNNDVSESTGTILACVNYNDKYVPKKNVCVAAGLDEGHYFQMAFDENGAGSLEWYQKTHAPELTIAELLTMASATSSEGLIAKPVASGYNNLEGFDHANQSHHHGHFVRAILESTARSLDTILSNLTGQEHPDHIIATGGGAMSRLWTVIKADTTGIEFSIPECSETACLGAAMLAATSVNKFKNLEEAGKNWIRKREIIEPDVEII